MLITKIDAVEMLGITPLARTLLTDEFVFQHLLTPTVRAMLGQVTSIGEPKLFETIAGHFPGDEANNLNEHLLYGGKAGYVRYPYISQLFRTTYGAVVLKRDANKLKLSAWLGDVDKGRGELIHMVALRDRHKDGSKQANDCALLDFPYDDPFHHRRIHPTARSLELSIYSFAPGSRLVDATGDAQFDEFVSKPFTFAGQTETFMKNFHQAWKTRRAPGQNSVPIRDVSKVILPGFEELAKSCGYDFLESAPSHYHVAMWLISSGYKYTRKNDQETMDRFTVRLAALRENGQALTRSQQSWVCVLQNLQERAAIPAHLNLGDLRWPQDNIGPQTLWVYKPLSQFALALEAGGLLEG